MSAFVIDTNVYSSFLRSEPAATHPLDTAHEVHVPLIVVGELLAGFAAGGLASRNREELARFMASPRVLLLNLDERTAHHYGDLYAVLKKQGTPIPTNDLWIAALARQHRLTLFSFDQHFRVVPGLSLYPA